MNQREIVESFIGAWNNMDMETVYDMMSDDIVWHNIPLEPARGKEAIRAMMDGLPAIEDCNWITHAIAVNGDKVLTERTDNFTLAGGKQASIKVMGTFEIDGSGKISRWRDYFDSAEFQREFLS